MPPRSLRGHGICWRRPLNEGRPCQGVPACEVPMTSKTRRLAIAAGVPLALLVLACGTARPSTSGASSGSGTGGAGNNGAAGTAGTAGTAGIGDLGGSGGSAAAGGTGGAGGQAGSGGGLGIGGAPGIGGASGDRGTDGVSGASGAGGGGAPVSSGECNTNEDCRLVEDCCTCAALPEGADIVACAETCASPSCAAGGITADDVTCSAGRCVINRGCGGPGAGSPVCGEPAPSCVDGTIPSMNGSCWGPCVAPEDCVQVPSCDVCVAAGLACTTYNGGGARCVVIPPECEENPTCACVNVCPGGAPCASPNSTDLSCRCQTC